METFTQSPAVPDVFMDSLRLEAAQRAHLVGWAGCQNG